ncbi:MAG: UvrD-helicase domain-containing protein, partial [Christensenellaceae bacterium]|nr:UvrD-helicase domain-containing protein [Christensenellaceae bacterium]
FELEEILDKEDVKRHISKAKNLGLSPSDYYQNVIGVITHAEKLRDVYEEYERRLKTANAMDFDDLLCKAYDLFTISQETIEKYQRRFKYVHIDEFQDINPIQFAILKLLVSKWGNIFAVGDDDQSIYGWRGADVSNILQFDKYFADVKIHKLLQNYRSTKQILAAANNLIKCNTSRHEKTLFTDLPDGKPVVYYKGPTTDGEAHWVVTRIKALLHSGYTYSDVAIIIRFNWISRQFESAFMTNSIPYVFVGGFRFFERKEIQDVIAYMRIVANERDRAAVERVINFPKRGIGEITIERLNDYATANNLDLMTVINDISNNGVLTGVPQKKIEEFRTLICDLQSHKNLSIFEFAQYVVDRAGFENAYKNTGKEDDMDRWDNVKEFVQHAREFSISNPEATLEDFLQTLALAPDIKAEKDTDKVTISTAHGSKGLEFKAVFIVCCEDGVFPSYRAISDKEKEEERRIMYVAITRAKEQLFISYPITRYRYNEVSSSTPSGYITEARGGIPLPNEIDNVGNTATPHQQEKSTSAKRSLFTPKKQITSPIANYSAVKYAQVNTDVTGYVVGANVSHATYGNGQIVLLTGEGDAKAVSVHFPNLGTKKFLLRYATLNIIE